MFHFSFSFFILVHCFPCGSSHSQSFAQFAGTTDRSIYWLLVGQPYRMTQFHNSPAKVQCTLHNNHLTVFLPFYSFPSRFWTHKHTNISLESNEDVNKTKKYGIWMFLSNAQWEANKIDKNLFLLLEKNEKTFLIPSKEATHCITNACVFFLLFCFSTTILWNLTMHKCTFYSK